MTPSARIQAAIEILDEIVKGTAAEAALTRWSRKSKFAGSKDRNAVRDHVFDVIRCKRSSIAYGGGETGRAMMIGYLRQFDQPLDELFGQSTYGPPALSDEERTVLGNTPILSAGEEMDFPDWLLPELEASLGDDLFEISQLFKKRAPVFLRVNRAKADFETVKNALAGSGYDVSGHPLSPDAIVVGGNPRGLRNHPLFLDGSFEFQDGASQALVDALTISEGITVLDYCAGGGGKSLAVAAKGAKVTATDIDPDRMREVPLRAERAGAIVRVVEQKDAHAFGPYDVVLCDAPCSGSGAWRRQPAAKWHLDENRLEELNNIQSEIIQDAAPLVAEGGVLAFATCSVLERENAKLIQSFAKSNPAWKIDKTISISPLRGGDGFFLAVLTRVSGHD